MKDVTVNEVMRAIIALVLIVLLAFVIITDRTLQDSLMQLVLGVMAFYFGVTEFRNPVVSTLQNYIKKGGENANRSTNRSDTDAN